MTLNVNNTVGPGIGNMVLYNFMAAITNYLTVQTAFEINEALSGQLTNIESMRLLGSSLLTSCVSPQMFKGGKISALAAHTCFPDWSQVITNPNVIDKTKRVSYYNGNFVTPPGGGRTEDGGLYSILIPKRYGLLPRGEYCVDLPNRTTMPVYHMDALEQVDRSYGYNCIYLKPEFATLDTTPHVRLQLIAAQTVEFCTSSQIFNSLRPNSKSADWNLLNDVISNLMPFSPNPTHTGKIAEVLRTVGTVGSVMAPIGAAIALAAGNPEVAAILGIAEAGLVKLSEY